MKSQIHKWMALVAMLFCLVFVVTNATAKKPPKPPPEPAMDSCETSEAYFPAFTFWKQAGTRKDRNRTIYLASEDGVCIRALGDIPHSEIAPVQNTAFSYNRDTNHGRVVWGDWYGGAGEVWLQEFDVEGNTITVLPDPELILVLPDHANTDLLEARFNDIDISPDLQKLAFIFSEVRLAGITYEIHVVEIDDCRDSPCEPSTATQILSEGVGYDPYRTFLWHKITWGPLGDRIYLQQTRGLFHVSEQSGVRMITKIEGSWIDQELFTEDEYPEYDGVLFLTSGIFDEREKLAFQHYGDCYTISVIDVADCEAGSCAAEAQTFGASPSWADNGTIIHGVTEKGKLNKNFGTYTCTGGFIGEWDPVNSEVTPLVEGADPDAG